MGRTRADAGPPVVLYIEDALSSLALIERLLERSGVTLLTAADGATGLAQARHTPPDLVLLDLHLPDMPGEEVLSRLRAVPETRATPVVVISADASPRRIRALLGAGVLDYLTKPIDVKRLLALFDQALGRPMTQEGFPRSTEV
ncbi:MAG: response regulator [Armatimonadota bacterium]|nr:response regulator [Armatimonadota bacterium]MDR7453825.1 response regulator [Armatimonadota bacterium]MDR7456426.1 response regulator [Armatimonadota bacterium]MDR7495916.1 response regulator [Armatimonadota bacterium]MDR7511835.1 response regulator [Armatimonadota bacterium]